MSDRAFKLYRPHSHPLPGSPESLEQQTKRLLEDQLSAALNAASAKSGSRKDHFHEIRRRLKKARALVRLVRGAIGEKEYRRANRRYRDVARRFSQVRDADVLLETFDRVSPRRHSPIRRQLQELHVAITRRALKDQRSIHEAERELKKSRLDLGRLSFRDGGWEALQFGVRRVYARGRRAAYRLEQHPTDEAFHDWRKSAKYLRYQMEVLSPCWPEILGKLADQLHRLSDSLGEDHDLVTLRQTLEEHIDFDDRKFLTPLIASIEARQKALRESALRLGRLLYGEKPSAFIKRLEHYWRAGKSDVTGRSFEAEVS